MAKKKNAIKYFLDHPQIKRKKALGNGEGPKKSSGGFMAGVKSLFSSDSKKTSTETNAKSTKTSFASNSGGAAKASSGFGALLAGKQKK